MLSKIRGIYSSLSDNKIVVGAKHLPCQEPERKLNGVANASPLPVRILSLLQNPQPIPEQKLNSADE
ncbi:MAG: hypothetical protein BROFUL_03091 [Candidatus Brocadia fulgida]|uniref:Uncharacterized protein n=1 Tax=Candidatus Brocadia fulgida TaxID=380242 RepID=A0A0M2UQ28_9BACT|nr:MAG: hypothetical protein BROFUL_03091 [Candidatus Brocadia fulgida]